MRTTCLNNKIFGINGLRILPFLLILVTLTACVKTGDTRDTPTPAETSEPSVMVAAPASEPRATSAYALPEPENYTGEIDVDDVMSKLCILAKYINTIPSQSEPQQLDLLYFAIEYVLYGPNVTRLDFNNFLETGPELSVSSETLAECLYAVFGIKPDYLDRFKDYSYQFLSKDDYYDAETDSFFCRDTNAIWLYGEFHDVSYSDTEIHIEGNRIDVRTLLTSPDGKILSADYKLSAVTQDGELYYRLISSDIYEDARNKNMLIITLDDTEFYAPWLTVIQNGDTEYYPLMNGMDNGYESWSRPFHALSLPPQSWTEKQYHDVNDNTGICKCMIYNGTAYLTFIYYGVCDTFVFDINTRTGYWMSGADKLDTFYNAELESLRKIDAEGGQLSYYLNFYVVTINQELGYALLRRSDSAGGVFGGLKGKYFMRNLTTGEEAYICGSYTRDSNRIVSFMDEAYEWKNSEYLRIGTVADKDDGWMVVYDVVFDGQKWIASETDEPYWE